MASLFGLLNINKPAACTSRDVVNRVQRLVRPAKAGHAGTLDPLATGVLVVCVGSATRLIEYIQQQAKRYEATFLLGRRSETEDVEGSVEELDEPPVPSRAELEAVLPRLLGVIEQRPPAYSAIKVGGKRAYELARAGQDVKLEPRKVRIDELVIDDYDYPQLRLAILCGSGTYVRSLGRDLAEAVGTAAVMSQLCRTAVGDFSLAQSIAVDDLEAAGIGRVLLPPTTAVAHLPRIVLEEDEVAAVRQGRFLARPDVLLGQEIAALDTGGRLVAILIADSRGRIKSHRNFASSL